MRKQTGNPCINIEINQVAVSYDSKKNLEQRYQIKCADHLSIK